MRAGCGISHARCWWTPTSPRTHCKNSGSWRSAKECRRSRDPRRAWLEDQLVNITRRMKRSRQRRSRWEQESYTEGEVFQPDQLTEQLETQERESFVRSDLSKSLQHGWSIFATTTG